MNMRRNLKTFGKIILAGITAFAVLTVFGFFYYNIPVSHPTEDGVTDYNYEPNVFYARGTEGYGWGRTNSEGYMNLFDLAPDQQTDVLFVGSSHMEAYQLPLHESMASRLSEMMPEDVVYNIGISGHNFLTCVNNLEAAVNKYRPSRCVVLEIGDMNFSADDLAAVLNGTLEDIPPRSGRIISLLKSNPYLRLMLYQIKNFMKQSDGEAGAAKESAKQDIMPLMDGVLAKISGIARDGNTQALILYHPPVRIGADGSMQILDDEETVRKFKELCDSHGIGLVDLSNRFLQEYEKDYTLAYGFVNSSVGSGHLNSAGHAMAAEELYKVIGEMQ